MTAEILLTAYNGAEYLPELLASLESQSDPDFTVLVQDDGSSDGTPRLLADCFARDSRFRPGAEQGLHLGAAGNFCSLLRQTGADAVLLCDQDDVWEPEKVALLKEALLRGQEELGSSVPLLVHSDCRIVDGAGRVLGDSFFRHQGWDPAAVTLPPLLVQNNVTGCTLIMNRALARLAAAHARPEKLFMHDWFIALTAAAFGEIRFLDRPLTRYRQHGENTVGASRNGLGVRGVKALGQRARAKKRIQLAYDHARAFRDQYAGVLPEKSVRVIDGFLATEEMPKIRRVLSVRRMGCRMQSPVTRAGQLFFG